MSIPLFPKNAVNNSVFYLFRYIHFIIQKKKLSKVVLQNKLILRYMSEFVVFHSDYILHLGRIFSVTTKQWSGTRIILMLVKNTLFKFCLLFV